MITILIFKKIINIKESRNVCFAGAHLASLLGGLALWWVLIVILSPLPAWPQLSATVWPTWWLPSILRENRSQDPWNYICLIPSLILPSSFWPAQEDPRSPIRSLSRTTWPWAWSEQHPRPPPPAPSRARWPRFFSSLGPGRWVRALGLASS